MKYRRKPYEIEAIQYDGYNRRDIEKFTGYRAKESCEDLPGLLKSLPGYLQPRYLIIKTSTQELNIKINDYITQSPRGCFHVYTPEVFESKYEIVQS